jgi:vitamin B12 transporter
VIDSVDLKTRLDVQGSLRDQVGGQAVQTGQIGGLTAVYVRGGPGDANKVMVDGIPINDVGGIVDFSFLQADGFDRVEFQRGPNSALYGSDALASVISINTQHGTTPLPLFSFASDGGNFGTYHEDGSVGGYLKRLDYFSAFSGFGTQNSVPNSAYHRDAYLGNFGYQLTSNTSLRATVRRMVAGFDSANASAAYPLSPLLWQADLHPDRFGIRRLLCGAGEG